jgi:hypothetical protein
MASFHPIKLNLHIQYNVQEVVEYVQLYNARNLFVVDKDQVYIQYMERKNGNITRAFPLKPSVPPPSNGIIVDGSGLPSESN